ncbi:hypothetical protein RRG08_024391 [Elysia crispata]|uniref:Uncharacterized protein n=1 Tax=Elysia crispata TaxID=231223 RepID=A0AAE0YPG4_9GAST|nr:hypothetical protein RRG08_024391 [Elysia crispata]
MKEVEHSRRRGENWDCWKITTVQTVTEFNNWRVISHTQKAIYIENMLPLRHMWKKVLMSLAALSADPREATCLSSLQQMLHHNQLFEIHSSQNQCNRTTPQLIKFLPKHVIIVAGSITLHMAISVGDHKKKEGKTAARINKGGIAHQTSFKSWILELSDMKTAKTENGLELTVQLELTHILACLF